MAAYWNGPAESEEGVRSQKQTRKHWDAGGGPAKKAKNRDHQEKEMAAGE
jgi:hypothetical protein